MRFTIIWSSFSEKQIDAIFDFYLTKTKSERIANKIIKKIIVAPNRLMKNPNIGQQEDTLKNREIEYRYIVESNYKIIYSVHQESNQIRITDVFDTRQDPKKIMKRK